MLRIRREFVFALAMCCAAGAAAGSSNPGFEACELDKLYAIDAGQNELFGFSVAISGHTAAVGAPTYSLFSWDQKVVWDTPDTVYLIDLTTGDHLHALTVPQVGTVDAFGTDLAMDGDTLIVGATAVTDNWGLYDLQGSARVFNVTTGELLHTFTGVMTPSGEYEKNQPTSTAYDQFGRSVAISGGRALVSVSGDDELGENAGAVYVFDVSTGQELMKLTASDGAPADSFGASVALSGNIALVGAPQDDDNGSESGSVYVFDVASGRELRKLTASDGEAGDSFGVVALDNGIAVIGAPGDDDNGMDAGAVYVFDVTNGQELFKLIASDAEDMAFGQHVEISGNVAAIGGFSGNANGVCYLFDVTIGQELASLVSSDIQPGDAFARNSIAIHGDTVLVGARGDDDFGGSSGSAYVFSIADANSNGVADECEKPDPADLNGDGFVNAADLALLLGAWGECGECPADLNSDGDVDAADLALLLGAWSA